MGAIEKFVSGAWLGYIQFQYASKPKSVTPPSECKWIVIAPPEEIIVPGEPVNVLQY